MQPLPSLDELRQAGKRELSRLLTRLETSSADAEVAAFLDKACRCEAGMVLGLTGPPGVGKSTLTDALIRQSRAAEKRVAVLAIDPSSQLTGGALLGDRTRLQTDPEDQAVFVRSMAARDRLGGLSDHAIAAIAMLRSVFDLVIVESVGIGQSEGDLVHACDTLVLCIQPGSGDSLQFMKAGIMELPDVVTVTKSDMGAAARRAASDVVGALSLAQPDSDQWTVPVCEISARTGSGIEDLMRAIEKHKLFLDQSGCLQTRRAAQHEHWFKDMVRTRYGTAGLDIAKSDPGQRFLVGASVAPFSSYRDFSRLIKQRLFDEPAR
ncbi:ArgK/MeaB family GTPase [Roseibium polysiphoniae]|uniref:Methylmalonyl Co-A mutase-associated GTPase MeaB n=1 Tax=Roseibium polysiphoniae TaxID=2571221 RepID=A0ABR9C9G4_9HYPH|nr:methylmalonyl Co-A mutase-associated GTPase MeaB [Roseibium polysiphoniae]MBD8876558.1 methylmalonyl Co-A mutase-associated GTPase MeaB [Roseibium polysiphoniae]